MRNLILSNEFKKDLKRISRGGRYDIRDIEHVRNMLREDIELPDKYRDHQLKGEWKGYRECHIKPDWLLIYYKRNNDLIMVRTGSHSELFD